MEAHLVHIAADGELAVIGVLMKEGKENSFISKIFDNMPTNSHAGHNKVKHSNIKVNTNDILPVSKDHWHYMGSLTTPPCTQIVEWYLLKEPISISSEQLIQFQGLYNGNARPTQPLNKRVILQK
jgi:carbonic anhydrase